MSGRFDNIPAVYDAVLQGIRHAAPLFLFYVLIIQIYASLRFMMP
jgi:hypothetical protein